MAPPSQLAIATGSVSRLVKEETSYHKELKQQETRLEKLLASTEENENAEYQQKQERAAIEETKKVFPPLRERIKNALQKLEDQLEAGEDTGASQEEITKAKEVIEQAKEVTKEEK